MLARRLPPLLLLLGLLGGCSRPSPAPAESEPLRIAAASDLQTALPRLIDEYRKTHPGKIIASFGASGQFAQQIRQGAPFDLFLSANRPFVAGLDREGLIVQGSMRDYARGTLVLAVHEPSGALIQSLSDLDRPEIRKIALANPETAPYGRAGLQVLERSGLWERVAPKLAQGESVVQAMQFVRSGNAEAGFAGKAIARVEGVRIVAIDPALYDPIIQALGVVAASKKPREAEDFARFLLSPEAQSRLAEFGFGTP